MVNSSGYGGNYRRNGNRVDGELWIFIYYGERAVDLRYVFTMKVTIPNYI